MANGSLSLGKADLHVHSNYSGDAFTSIREILKKAQERGLNLIAITDHNVVEGAKKAQKIAPEFGIEVVIGEEVMTKQGEIIALFIHERIPPNLDLLDAIKKIKNQEGLIIVPHLFNFWQKRLSKENFYRVSSLIDGIEILNSSWWGEKNFPKLQKLSKSESFLKLAPTAGSDAHFAALVGRSYTLFEGKSSSDLIAAIKSGKTAVEGKFWTKEEYHIYFKYWSGYVTKHYGFLFVSGILRKMKRLEKFLENIQQRFKTPSPAE